MLQIEALQAQLEEKIKFSNDQVSTLVEDRKVRMEEQEAQRERDSAKIKTLSDNLKKTQTLLYDSTKDFLELKYESRLKERKWMNERDKIMQEMDYLKEQIDMNQAEHDMNVITRVHVGNGFLFTLCPKKKSKPTFTNDHFSETITRNKIKNVLVMIVDHKTMNENTCKGNDFLFSGDTL